jgi:REP element-mobilizing transposase RayT
MPPTLLATMVTTTSYGTWLPGDLRGYVENGTILPGDPNRLQQATQRLKGSPILFTLEQQNKLFDALRTAADEFSYKLTDASIESWHLHWMCHHGYDSVPKMVGRIKNRLRQALNIGRIWTEGYYDSMCFDDQTIQIRRRYIARHAGCRMTNGKIIDPNSPY